MFSDLRISGDEKQLRFRVRAPNAVVNALRRAIIAHVPTAAFPFDPVAPASSATGLAVIKNTSVIHNEMLGVRVSLVPVCADEALTARLRQTPDMYRFRLRKKNTGTEVVHVTTADMEVLLATEGAAEAPAPKEIRDALFPACPTTGDHILLTKLRPNPYDNAEGEEVHVEGVLRVKADTEGATDGQKHARWSPVSVCYFVNVVDEAAADRAFEVAEHKAIEDGEDASEAARLSRRRQFDSLERLRSFFPDFFEFQLESECGLRCPFLVASGFRVLLSRVEAIRDAVEARDTSKVSFLRLTEEEEGETGGASSPVVNVCVADEDHTCGNLIQGLLYQRNFRANKNNRKDLEFVGYHQPHPLEREIVLRLRCTEPSANVEAVLLDNLQWVVGRLRWYLEEWVKFGGMGTPAARKKYAMDAWGM